MVLDHNDLVAIGITVIGHQELLLQAIELLASLVRLIA